MYSRKSQWSTFLLNMKADVNIFSRQKGMDARRSLATLRGNSADSASSWTEDPIVLSTCMTQRQTDLLKCALHCWQRAEVRIPRAPVSLVSLAVTQWERSPISKTVLTFNISSIFGHRVWNCSTSWVLTVFIVMQRTSGRVLKLNWWCCLRH